MAIAPAGFNWFWYFIGALLLVLVFATTTVYLARRLKMIQAHAWLVDLMAECKDGEMGMIVDKGGKIVPIAIEHNPKNIGLAVHKRYTLIHPDLAKPNTKHKMKGGPQMSFYPLPGYFPFSIQSAAALVQLANDLREDPRFSWITDELGLIALMFNSTESFPRDAKQLVQDCVAFGDEIPDDYLDDSEDRCFEEDYFEDIKSELDDECPEERDECIEEGDDE